MTEIYKESINKTIKYLIHGTTIHSLKKIIKDGKIKPCYITRSSKCIDQIKLFEETGNYYYISPYTKVFLSTMINDDISDLYNNYDIILLMSTEIIFDKKYFYWSNVGAEYDLEIFDCTYSKDLLDAIVNIDVIDNLDIDPYVKFVVKTEYYPQYEKIKIIKEYYDLLSDNNIYREMGSSFNKYNWPELGVIGEIELFKYIKGIVVGKNIFEKYENLLKMITDNIIII
jgi:hypothetical protein